MEKSNSPVHQHSITPVSIYNVFVFFSCANRPELFETPILSILDLFAFFFKPHVLIRVQIKCRCIYRFAGN